MAAKKKKAARKSAKKSAKKAVKRTAKKAAKKTGTKRKPNAAFMRAVTPDNALSAVVGSQPFRAPK